MTPSDGPDAETDPAVEPAAARPTPPPTDSGEPASDAEVYADTGAPNVIRLAGYLRHHPGGRAVLAVLVALLAVAGYFAWRHFSVRESTDDAFIDGPVVAIAPRVPGTVEAVHVDENDDVDAGAVLVELRRHPYELRVAKAQADLAAAEAEAVAAGARVPIATTSSSSGLSAGRAGVEQARAGVAAAEQAVSAAEAHLESAQADAEKADQDLARMEELVAKDEVPRESYEHAAAAAKSAHAAVSEARQGVAVARSRHGEAEAALARARAALQDAGSGPHRVAESHAQEQLAKAKAAQARAALELARSDLDDTVIRAPVAGRIGRKNVEVGETVQTGQPLLALVPLADVWVTANYKETQIADMRPGQRAVVHVDALGRDFEGHVESLGAATGSKFSLLPAQNATGNYVKVVQRVPVRIALEAGQDPDHLLRPGLSVVPTVITE